MKNIIYIVLLLLVHMAFGQTREAVIEKTALQYSIAQPLHFNLTYNLYKSSKDKKVEEVSNGTYYKNEKNEVYTKVGQTEYFVTKKVSVQISHAEKAMLFSPHIDVKQQMDINKLMLQFNKGYFKDMSTHWEVELLAKQFSNLPYSRIVLYIGKDYYIQKQLFYYNTPKNFAKNGSKQDIQYPVLEVVYGKATRNPAPASVFTTSAYFTISNTEIKLNGKYKDYQIIDKRKKI